MSRLRQRRFFTFSESLALTRDPAINDSIFDPATHGIIPLNEMGEHGVWSFAGGAINVPLPVNFGIGPLGELVQTNSDIADGEYYNGVVAQYTPQICASRIQRSDYMIEYELLDAIALGNIPFNIVGFNPRAGTAAIIGWQVNTAGPTLTEWAAGLGLVAGAFASEMDADSNKLLFSARRINANTKNLVVSWYDRNLAAVQTVTQVWAGGGTGDQPIMWYWSLPACRLVVKKVQCSSTAIAYGNPPV